MEGMKNMNVLELVDDTQKDRQASRQTDRQICLLCLAREVSTKRFVYYWLVIKYVTA